MSSKEMWADLTALFVNINASEKASQLPRLFFLTPTRLAMASGRLGGDTEVEEKIRFDFVRSMMIMIDIKNKSTSL
jgi:hypothetical protein